MKTITFKFGGERKVFHFNDVPGGVGVDSQSLVECELAKKIARDSGMSFGESLKKARRQVALHILSSPAAANFADFNTAWVEMRLDPNPDAIMSRAEQIARDEGLPFADAIKKARSLAA